MGKPWSLIVFCLSIAAWERAKIAPPNPFPSSTLVSLLSPAPPKALEFEKLEPVMVRLPSRIKIAPPIPAPPPMPPAPVPPPKPP